MNNELIALPEDADRHDFAPFVEAGEFIGYIHETRGGAKYVCGRPAARDAAMGCRVVQFRSVVEGGGRRSKGTFKGWAKVQTEFCITGAGVEYKDEDGRVAMNFYVSEIK